MLWYYVSYQAQDALPWRLVRVWEGNHEVLMHFDSKQEAEKWRDTLPATAWTLDRKPKESHEDI